MGWLSLALGLAVEIFKLTNTKVGRKYIDRSVELQLELSQEEAKPYEQQDDARIVALKKEAAIIIEAAKSEAELLRAKA